jgi:hypothetical protein
VSGLAAGGIDVVIEGVGDEAAGVAAHADSTIALTRRRAQRIRIEPDDVSTARIVMVDPTIGLLNLYA